MHLMLAPEVLCRLLSGDPALSAEAKRMLRLARMLSVPAASLSVLAAWGEDGTLEGDLLDVITLLEHQGVTVVPLNANAFRVLGQRELLTPQAMGIPLQDRLVLAQAIASSAMLLTENQPLFHLAPGNALWLPANIST